MGPSYTRREFLKGAGVTALTLSLGHLWFVAPQAHGAEESLSSGLGPQTPGYQGWEDLYRKRWKWDRVVRSSHFVNCWYQAHCCFNVYMKDGMVWREEQAGDYPQTAPHLPDFNPRGCQKGACFSARMYDPARVKYPLKRMGERGEGKWQRVSWEEALTEIADTFIKVLREEGSDRIVWSLGPLYTFGPLSAGQGRLSFLLNNVQLDMNTEIGDGHHGAAVTFGKILAERSADDYFHSDLILIWGCNPFYSQIPNAHFSLEARYHGAKLVAISPDYNASAIHTDLWIPVNPGTDAALALSLAQVIVQEKLYREDFLREQTDMPFLVREDTRRFLRESDLKGGGREEVLYLFDARTNQITEAPRKTLTLEDLVPALEGTHEVETLEGKVRVRPVFALLRERLQDYTPERASKICRTSPDTIRKLARMIGSSKAVSNITSANFSKYYHGNLMERAQILVFALCGHMGKKGSGFSAFPLLSHDALEPFVVLRRLGPEGLAELQAETAPVVERLRAEGFTEEMIIYEAIRQAYVDGTWVSGTLFWNIHGGLADLSGRSQEWDPHLPKDAREYLQESLQKGWQHVFPPPGADPRILIEYGSNILRRIRGYPQLLQHLFPKLKLIVVMDWRMSSTGLYADYVLPACGWYERTEHKWVTPLMPFIHAGTKVVDFYEAKSDWEICCLLAKKVQERARERGITTFRDRKGRERRLDTIYDQLTFSGHYTERDEERVAADLIHMSTNLQGVNWEELKTKGYARFTGVGRSPVSIGNACDVKPGETISPFAWHVEKKMPYPTLTRRIQFYIDHELYLELGEELPVHKDPPASGGKYPLMMTGGHTRWSIHAAWRDDARMLRLQRGGPVMYMSVTDAKKRGIADGEEVEVRNDIAAFRIRVKVSPAVQPGQVIVYHAWENFQFKDGKGFQNLIPSPLNPVELAGGQYHLRPMFICLQPGQSDRDTRVEVRKL